MAESQLIALETFLKHHPTIQFIPLSSPEFDAVRKICNSSHRDVPLAIARPQSPEDVSTLVKFARSKGITFTIRSGGHNMEGRAIAAGALAIDMRALTSVQVAADRQSATVQGGILQGELGQKLWAEGVATPTGAIPCVGYVGWAMYGGYGPFSSHWGLGVDQILGATVVNPDGEIVKADERLLKGIRGAGGVFGVIVDMTIKVYPLTKLLAGVIMYDSQDIAQTLANFNAGYQKLREEGLPAELTTQQMAGKTPGGRTFGVMVVWSSDDLNEGQRWVDKVASFAPSIINMVAPTTIPEWFEHNSALVPSALYGSSHTHNLREVSAKTATILGNHVQQMPSDQGAMFSIHELRGPSTIKQDNSVFAAREPHVLLEILGFSTEEKSSGESQQWAARFADDVRKMVSEDILSTAYISLCDTRMNPEQKLSDFYGSYVEEIEALKREFDPVNVFSLSFPQIK